MDIEVESSSEAKTSQNALRIIREGDQRLEWSANHSVCDVIESSLSVVFDLLCVYIVEETINGEIPA